MNPTAAYHTITAAKEKAERHGEPVADAVLDAFRQVEKSTQQNPPRDGSTVEMVIDTARRTRDRILSNISKV